MSLEDLTERILRRIQHMTDDEIVALFEREVARVRGDDEARVGSSTTHADAPSTTHADAPSTPHADAPPPPALEGADHPEGAGCPPCRDRTGAKAAPR